jgi:glyoxylate/hydroxypyruvate reductase
VHIAILIPDVAPETWFEPLQRALKNHVVVDAGSLSSVEDCARIEIAVVGWAQTYDLGRFPNLRFVQSNFMGVDRLLNDPTLPETVPIARMVDPDMPVSMTESVLAHVLAAHRQLDVYQRQQQEGEWIERDQPLARKTTVAILGLGELGRAAASALLHVGFRVVGFSRSATPIDGVSVSSSIDEVLAQSQIVVNLLPLTEATRGILCARTFAMMPKNVVLINLARGAHLNDDDLLVALRDGHIRHAVLDVFTVEPLPNEHVFWRHPQITLTPHMAANSTPQSCIPVIVDNIERFARNEKPFHLVDRVTGY